MSDDTISVVFGCDRDYAMQLTVALRSLSQHVGEAPCTVYVLESGFDTSLRHRVEQSCGPAVVPQWISVPNDAVADLRQSGQFPKATLFRLLAPQLLPSHLARIVYLDADILVREPLDELWSADVESSPVAAVRDAFLPLAGYEATWRDLGVDPRAPFFNAGVLVIGRAAWSEMQVSERALTLLRERALAYDDQSALNAVIGPQWSLLSPRWNLQSHHLAGDTARPWSFEETSALDEAIARPAIVHFTKAEFSRPWQAGSSHPYRDEWLEVLDQTPWRGWRPRRAWGAGALRRVFRAGDALVGRSRGLA
jgi:lipopolysaccharide biosynthesis glycosyltransferase